MLTVDLNCDMGEAFGPWPMGRDAELMRFISSANIACGFHAGDASTMRKTVELAKENGVAVGAHPGYPDLQGFGRRNMSLSPGEVYDQVIYQVSALRGICETQGVPLCHVKPHGALYNQAARDERLAAAIADAVRAVDPRLILVGLSGSELIRAGQAMGLTTASEVFIDRTYQPDGSLTPRSEPNALIEEADLAVSQALQMIEQGTVTAVEGNEVAIRAETICIHGDGEHAVDFAAAIRREFESRSIRLAALSAGIPHVQNYAR